MKNIKSELKTMLGPYIEIIESQDFIEDILAGYVSYTPSKRYTEDELREDYLYYMARVLKALKESWAEYDTPETLKELIISPIPVGQAGRITKAAEDLTTLGLVESQGIRYRLKNEKRGK